MSGYRTVHRVEAVSEHPTDLFPSGLSVQQHRVEVIAWNAEAPSLVSLSSGYDKEITMFQVEDLVLFIALLQQTKALLEAAPKDSGAADSPISAAPVTTTKETA
ncbi:hypothetical protein RI444_15280 [Paenarthrobacter sp. AT5]|uniref:hypothetical protein n=1 Tax=Paenarthrobacter TaxID=1742992 RepID=UPI001A9959C6|nr:MULTISPECIES: hypothetical protein [Paenarthrobacter]QSZ53305.1 hypothetical protein AYX19_09990 [Paenarthrobacter ureafaciens]WOC59869.1 hypothetical protein RI444_15280 [Paenarthrobacter sp. AT5]